MNKISIIIGDLVESREAVDRDSLQSRLQVGLEKVNRRYGYRSIAPAEIVRGDEFEAGFEDPSFCYRAFGLLERELFPARIRAGIGVGSVSTSLKESISLMDGSAFHRARSAIENAEKEDSDLMIESSLEELDRLVNTIFSLMSIIKESWTDRQREMVNYYLANLNLTQKEIAYEFGVSQPAVAKTLGRAKAKQIERTNEVLVSQLEEYGVKK